MTDSDTRQFPIQQGGSIPWWLAELAYVHYAKLFTNRQTLDRLAERGGFGKTELVKLLRRENPLMRLGDDADAVD